MEFHLKMVLFPLLLSVTILLLSSTLVSANDDAPCPDAGRLVNPFLEPDGSQTCPKEGDCWYPSRYDFVRKHYRELRALADAYFVVVNAVFDDRNKAEPKRQVNLTDTSKLLYISARKAAAMIRQKQLKSKDLIKAYTERIVAVNPLTKAVFNQNAVAALAMAEQVDAQIATMNATERAKLAKTKPLFGVPFTSKQNIMSKGFVIGACNWMLLNNSKPCEKDAEVIARVKNAGAIVLGITAMPNIISWACDDSACGQVNNPHDSRRTPGGSSSGEASIISSAGSIFGIGNDIAGSVRIPSHFCGIFGLKPTNAPGHLVPVEGIIPNFAAFKPAADMLSYGTLARYAEDFPLILSVMANKSMSDYDKPVDFAKKFRLFYMEDLEVLITQSLHPEQKNSVIAVKDYFEKKYGLCSQKVDFPIMDHLFEMWGLDGWTPGVMPLYPNLTQQFWDIYNSPPGGGVVPYTFLSWIYDVLKNYVFPRDAEERVFVAAKLDKVRGQLNELLGKDGVLVLPTWPTPPPYHHQEPFVAFDLLYTQVFNMLGNPAITVPTGKSAETGLPIGVQIAAAPYNEALLIAVGRELEKGFGGWVKPGQ